MLSSSHGMRLFDIAICGGCEIVIAVVLFWNCWRAIGKRFRCHAFSDENSRAIEKNRMSHSFVVMVFFCGLTSVDSKEKATLFMG